MALWQRKDNAVQIRTIHPKTNGSQYLQGGLREVVFDALRDAGKSLKLLTTVALRREVLASVTTLTFLSCFGAVSPDTTNRCIYSFDTDRCSVGDYRLYR